MDAIPMHAIGIDAADSAQSAPIDLERYFPLDPGLRWGLRYTAQRRNGDVIEEEMHWQLNGQIECNGKQAWLLGEKDKENFVISLDEEGIQHHGMISSDGPGEVCTPPLTSVSNRFAFRQTLSSPYLMKKGENEALGYFVHQMTGFETIRLPAGVFRDCLRTDTYYQRVGGTCFYSAIHFAPEVGVVRYSFRQVDPASNAVIIYGVKELSYFRRASN